MKDGDIIVIDSVKELWDDKQQAIVGRIITDKAGNETKVKKGQGGKLEDRWEWLDANAGKAIKLTVGEFKGYPYVADFEVVSDEFVKQATEKVQAQAKDSREDSIEAQVAFKGMVELLIAGKLDENEAKATIRWAMGRIALPTVIVTKIEEAKSETIKDIKGDKETQAEPPDRQDSRETTDEELPQTVGEFLTWLAGNGIKAPRAWLEVEFKLSSTEVLTTTKCQALYKTIKTKEKW